MHSSWSHCSCPSGRTWPLVQQQNVASGPPAAPTSTRTPQSSSELPSEVVRASSSQSGLRYFIYLSKPTVKVINEVLNAFSHFHSRQSTLRCLHQARARVEPRTLSTQPKFLKCLQPQDVTEQLLKPLLYSPRGKWATAVNPALSSLCWALPSSCGPRAAGSVVWICRAAFVWG